MTPSRGATASRLCSLIGLATLLVAGCAAPQIAPVPAADVEIDVGRKRAGAASPEP